ncbi:hypothetical protein [Lysinibacillus capsici]|uniref:hypothetical protein n=1 Tax=Lysinibacillus capsici TaxID=2115968 RepID=UPI003081FB19|nr:hypothetical protein ICJ70_12305 [Lysinibacillus capsici]
MNEESKFISRNQAAKSCGISGKCFNYLVNQEPFNKYLLNEDSNNILVNSDVMPLISDYYKTHIASFHYYNSISEYIPASRVAQMLNISYRELIVEVNSGKWSGMYVKTPKCAPPPKDLLDIKFNYFFLRSKFLKGKYNTIESIGKNQNIISVTQLQLYKRRGLLPQPEHLKHTNLYDENEIIELLPSLNVKTNEEFAEKTSDSITSAYDLLNLNQQKKISKYIDYRSKGGVVNYNGYTSKYQVANKVESLKVIKAKLSSAFVLIISGRCGIEEDFHKNPLHKNKTPITFNSDVLDLLSIRVEDSFYITSKRKGKTLINYYHQLKAFYYYLLDELEEEALDDPNDFRLFSKQKRNIEKFLNQFPKRDIDLKDSQINHKIKTFLTREQMVLIKQLILEDVRSNNSIKYATMWQLASTTGVRPQEFHKLEISHFHLDSKGYLLTDNDGWGLLSLPAKIAKQERSPSHPIYHTPIPRDTVKQLNQYISRLYMRQGEHIPRGKGYLFRKNDALPFYRYKKPIHFGFINRLRSRLDFIDDASKQDFIFKASRHSLNNTIMRTYINTDTSLNGSIKQTAADHQLRHKPAKSVGEEYYMDDIGKEQYYQVLDATINFPWDLEELRKWEENKGYRIQKAINIEKVTLNEVFDEETKELQEQLLVIEEQLLKLKEKPKPLTEQQWIATRQKLIKIKNSITFKLKGE